MSRSTPVVSPRTSNRTCLPSCRATSRTSRGKPRTPSASGRIRLASTSWWSRPERSSLRRAKSSNSSSLSSSIWRQRVASCLADEQGGQVPVDRGVRARRTGGSRGPGASRRAPSGRASGPASSRRTAGADAPRPATRRPGPSAASGSRPPPGRRVRTAREPTRRSGGGESEGIRRVDPCWGLVGLQDLDRRPRTESSESARSSGVRGQGRRGRHPACLDARPGRRRSRRRRARSRPARPPTRPPARGRPSTSMSTPRRSTST